VHLDTVSLQTNAGQGLQMDFQFGNTYRKSCSFRSFF